MNDELQCGKCRKDVGENYLAGDVLGWGLKPIACGVACAEARSRELTADGLHVTRWRRPRVRGFVSGLQFRWNAAAEKLEIEPYNAVAEWRRR